jgi:steroid delta-isomerase-like uncharacterized protein
MMNEQEENKALSRRWFEEVWNKRRAEAIDELLAPDGVPHGLEPQGNPPARGPAAFRPFWERFCGAFPDLKITVEDVIAEGGKTAVRFSFRGTHRGHHLGVPPSGNTIQCSGMTLIRWRNGKIAEAWNEFDAWGLMRQAEAV